MHKKLFTYTILFFGLTVLLQAQAEENEAKIMETIIKQGQAFIKQKNINSVSIGIYKDEKGYSQHFGELTKGKGDTPSNETLYEIGSVTKPMTGYLVAGAVLQGKLKLTDKVADFLIGDYDNLSYNGQAITIEHLLTHTAGLPMYLPMAMAPLFENLEDDVPQAFYELEKGYDKTQFFEDLKSVRLITTPGENYRYSNLGAELIGHILETVYKKDIDTLLNERLFLPAKMEHTGIHMPQEELDMLIKGYWKSNTSPSPNQLNPLWATGSGAKATLNDMIKFMAMQLNTEDPVITESQKVLFDNERHLKVAYFWRVWDDKYGRSYNHHGGTTGMQNWLFLFPKYNMGISIITNQSGPKTPGKLNGAVKKILKSLVRA